MAGTFTAESTDLSLLPPLRITHRGSDTDGSYVRAEAVVRPLPGRAEEERPGQAHRRWFEETGAISHVHPLQEEAIEVLEGDYMVRVKGTDRRLQAGERTRIPKNTAHAHWNPTGRPVRIAVEHHPAGQSDKVFEAMYRFAQAGKATASGLPDPVAAALIADRYPDVVYISALPVGLQKRLNRGVGRMAAMARRIRKKRRT